MSGQGEFEFIRSRLQALTRGHPGALNLSDDAALLPQRHGYEIVIASDMLVAGVHFLKTDTLDIAAQRAVRSNLSDMAAMGADPIGYLASIAWPKDISEAAKAAFVDGLDAAQREFGLSLLGGDTTSTPGPLTISLTLLGELPPGTAMRRSGAKPGDDVWVSGTIGDAGLGLQAAKRELSEDGSLLQRYQYPQPRLSLGRGLRDLATACVDVSDGLLADAGHIAQTSGVQILLSLDSIPLSQSAKMWAQVQGENGLLRLATAGDDYELCFTASPDHRVTLERLGAALECPLTRIGRVERGEGAYLLDASGTIIQVDRSGFTHF